MMWLVLHLTVLAFLLDRSGVSTVAAGVVPPWKEHHSVATSCLVIAREELQEDAEADGEMAGAAGPESPGPGRHGWVRYNDTDAENYEESVVYEHAARDAYERYLLDQHWEFDEHEVKALRDNYQIHMIEAYQVNKKRE